MGKHQSKLTYTNGRRIERKQTELEQVLQKKKTELDQELLIAAEDGNTVLTKNTIEEGADVNVRGDDYPYDTALHISSKNGYLDIAKALIEANADVNIKNKENYTALHLSSMIGHTDIAQELIEAKADVNIKTFYNNTALHLSSWLGRIGSANALIEANADVKIKDTGDFTALHLSSMKGYTDIAKALLEANADVNIKNADDDTALHLSSRNGHIDIAKALIEANADVNIKNKDNNTALHLPSRNGHIDIAKALIKAKANVNIENLEGKTALHLSSESGHINIAKALIEAKADVDIKGIYNNTALHLSLINGHIDIAKALIEAKANVNIKNADNDTALHLSLENDHIDIAKALIKAKADLNIKNANNDTALHLSVMKRHINIARALIEAKADVNIKNADHATALHLSSKNGHIDIAKALIEAKADVNIKNANNDTALHLSFKNSRTDIANALIEAKADVNCKDKDNNTALHLMTLEGNTLIVPKLIEHKADPNLKNYQGLKPVLLAALYGHTEIIRELFNGGATIDVNDPGDMSIIHTILMESDPESLKVVISELNCNASGNYRSMILQIAARLGCHEHMKCLLAIAGIHINSQDEFGKTPLHCASEIGNTDTIGVLLDAGCDVLVLDNTKKSVLHIASIYGHSGLVKLFIREGADPYQVDIFGRNCLHYAVMYRNEDVVGDLLKTNDDEIKYSRKDCNKKTPRQYLHECEKNSLMSRLLNGKVSCIQIISLAGDQSCSADISKCPHISEVIRQPYKGSVHAISGHDMSAFIGYVKKEVEMIVHRAIPESSSVNVQGVGSSFEGTKNGLPDELDFIIKLFHVKSSNSEQEGYGKMKRDEDEVKRLNIIGSYGMWLWQKLMAYWNECQTKGEKTRWYKRRRFAMPLPPQRHPDHKTCTTWIWLYSDGMFIDLPVSIDFVPAIETDIDEAKLRSTWMMTKNDMRKRKCYIVPKIPHENSLLSAHFSSDDVNQLGRVSYPTLEVEHLKRLDPRVKNVYITAKCLRKPEVCGFKIKNEKGETKSASEFVTSYRLKSVFLHLVLLFLNSNLSLGKMVLMVYEQLEKCLEKGNLPMFFDPEVNVLAGSKLSAKESLTVTRMMTQFVRALYERNSSEEMEKDSDEVDNATSTERHCNEMRIYEQKLKEWDDDDQPPWKKPKKPEPPYLVLLHTFILENLQQVISSEKAKNVNKDVIVSKGERQAQEENMIKQTQLIYDEDVVIYNRKLMNDWIARRQMEKSLEEPY